MDTLKVELTRDEITLLFEALDEWENVPKVKAFSDMLVTTMVSKNQQEAVAAIEKSTQSARRQELGRKRRSVLLKAKLIQVAEQSAANDLFGVKEG